MKIAIKKFNFESCKIMASLSANERAMVLAEAQPLFFRKKQLIFYDGGIPTGVFLIEKGKAKIFKTDLHGKDQIFYVYRQGDMLGYHALLCDEQYEDSCEALEDCQLLFISRTIFNKLLEQIPKLQQLLIQNMSHEFGVLVNTVAVLAQKPLRERLALFLLILDNRYRTDAAPEQPGKILLPREDLANIAGMARESLGRLLKEFREEGLVRVEGRVLQAQDFEGLHRIANGF